MLVSAWFSSSAASSVFPFEGQVGGVMGKAIGVIHNRENCSLGY